MFLEPKYRGQRSGWIEVVTGCMFSGKDRRINTTDQEGNNRQSKSKNLQTPN